MREQLLGGQVRVHAQHAAVGPARHLLKLEVGRARGLVPRGPAVPQVVKAQIRQADAGSRLAPRSVVRAQGDRRSHVIASTPGEAETWAFMDSGYAGDAVEAAELTGVKFDWWGELNEESEWLMRAWQAEAFVALEQCCDDCRVLPPQLREARLRHFSPSQRIAAEKFLGTIPDGISAPVLSFIYWTVRIERAKRTGSPEFNPRRPLVVEGMEE